MQILIKQKKLKKTFLIKKKKKTVPVDSSLPATFCHGTKSWLFHTDYPPLGYQCVTSTMP
jgi:hypothetical protein